MLCLSACAVFGTHPGPAPETVLPGEDARAASTLAQLSALEHGDVFIRFNNEPLARQMQAVLAEQAAAEPSIALQNIEIHFGHQRIHLTARVDEAGNPGLSSTVRLEGDVTLSFSGNALYWTPRFHGGRILVRDAGLEKDAASAVTDSLVRQANKRILDAVVLAGKNRFQLDYFPSARIEVGAAADEVGRVRFSGEQELGGFFGLVDSVQLIAPQFTSAVLDLERLENFSRCESDVQVSRAVFTSAVQQREPVDGLAASAAGEDLNFFTEIRGATRSTAVVHYWFADGRPVGFEELTVEPSARWRTWSARPEHAAAVNGWEIVVVERDTGCVLHTQWLPARPSLAEEHETEASAAGSYARLSEAFAQKFAHFVSRTSQPAWVVIETSREFMGDTFSDLLREAQVEVEMNLPRQEHALQAALEPFQLTDPVCSERECRASRVCQAAVSSCPRRHDSRDCMVCKFRNPLNNRCISEAEDPVCAGARAVRNRRFENERKACLAEEELRRQDCERQTAQEIRSCQLESRTLESTCQANLQALQGISPKDRMAILEGTVQPTGTSIARFTGFDLAPDFSSLGMAIEFSTRTSYEGSWHVVPEGGVGALGECLSAWQGHFESRLVMPTPRLSLLGSPREQAAAWETVWSGFVLPAQIVPTPLEAVFQERPELLAACRMGLRPNDVMQAVVSGQSRFFRGLANIEVRPLPSRLVPGPERLRFAGRTFSAKTAIVGGHLVVEAGDPAASF